MIEHLIVRYGLLGLCIGAGLEGETVTVIGGIMVHRGLLPFWPAVIAAGAGSFVADQLFFLLGRRFRESRRVRSLHDRPAFARAIATFERHPLGFTFAFRFLYGLRTISPIAIGTTRLPAAKFMAVNLASALVWGLLFVLLGFVSGHAIEVIFGRIQSIEHLLIAVLVCALAVALGLRLFLRSRAN